MAGSSAEEQEERHRLTAFEGLAALSLDALSSVAYGPQAIVLVLAAAGAAALDYTLPVTIAITILLPAGAPPPPAPVHPRKPAPLSH